MPFGANPWAAAPFGGLTDSNPPPSVTNLSRNVLLLSGRDSDAATLVPSSEIVTLPASNAQTVQPRRVWRALSNDEWLKLTFASAVAANALAIVGGNPSSFRRVRITAAADAADLDESPDLDTDWVNPWPGGARPAAPDWPNWLLLVRFENTDEMRYWKIEITDIGGAVSVPGGVPLTIEWDAINGKWRTNINTGPVAADAFRTNANNVNAQTGTSYTLLAKDNGKTITLGNASAITLTVPSGLPAGFSCFIVQLGAGQVTITASGTTLRSRVGLKTGGQYAQGAIVYIATNTYSVGGDLTT